MSEQTREALGSRIRELRKANRLSQEKLSLMVNVERSYLARLERGKRNPSIDCIEKIAGGLGVTLSELFDGIGPVGTSGQLRIKRDGHAPESDSANCSYTVVKIPRP